MRIPMAVLVVATTAAAAHADESVMAIDQLTDDHPADQGIGASVGLAGGGGMTAGGLRVAGHYLYQLSDQDWFDGVASFTYGGNSSGCTAPEATGEMQSPQMTCDHGVATGNAVEIGATVRRMFGADRAFQPFARGGVGVALVHFNGDGLSGIAFPIHLGGGVRAQVAPALAIVAQAELDVGFAAFSDGLGVEPQLGMAVTAGAEFELR
jgi:hypothetical protein